MVTGSGGLDPSSALFTDAVARTVVLLAGSAPADRRAALAEVADVVVAGGEHVDPAVALDALAERGLGRVLCEGGPGLFGRVAGSGRLDELCLTYAPVLAGPGPDRIVGGPPLPSPVPLTLGHLLEEDGFLFARYAAG